MSNIRFQWVGDAGFRVLATDKARTEMKMRGIIERYVRNRPPVLTISNKNGTPPGDIEFQGFEGLFDSNMVKISRINPESALLSRSGIKPDINGIAEVHVMIGLWNGKFLMKEKKVEFFATIEGLGLRFTCN